MDIQNRTLSVERRIPIGIDRGGSRTGSNWAWWFPRSKTTGISLRQSLSSAWNRYRGGKGHDPLPPI